MARDCYEANHSYQAGEGAMMPSDMAGESDTIVSMSTAVGLGAIGIVRLSGGRALADR